MAAKQNKYRSKSMAELLIRRNSHFTIKTIENQDSKLSFLLEEVEKENEEFVDDSYKRKCRKCLKNMYCKSRRDCCCCGIGSFLAVIVCVSFLMFTLFFFTSGSIKKDVIEAPSITKFTNSSSGPDYIYLEWQEPESNGGAFIENYTLNYKLSKERNWTTFFMSSKGLLLSQNITQLRGSTDYEFRINSVNNLLPSNWSDIFSVITKQSIAPFPPSAPFGIEIKKNENKGEVSFKKKTINFTIAFEANSNGGAAIQFYSVFYQLLNHKQIQPFCTVTKAEIQQIKMDKLGILNCSGTMKANELNKIYKFSVAATNSIGTSNSSKATSCFIPSIDSIESYMCKTQNVPTQMVPSSISFVVSEFEIDISWLNDAMSGEAPILSYELQRDDHWEQEPLHTVTIPNKGLSLYAQINELMPDTPYHMRIRAMNMYGNGEWSDILTAKTIQTEKCGNYHDISAMYDIPASAGVTMYLKCSISSTNVKKCLETKLRKQYHLSDGCSTCAAQNIYCAGTVCSSQCLKGSRDECMECMIPNCAHPFEQCAGFPSLHPDQSLSLLFM